MSDGITQTKVLEITNRRYNSVPNQVQKSEAQSGVETGYKREFAVRRDTDTVKNFTVSLLDIDTTIINYLNNSLNIQVMDNGTLIKVPVIYGNPENWTAVKKDGYLRDNQGKILLPALMIRRKSVENNKDLITFNRYLQYQTVMNYTEKNKYDRFDILNKSNIFKSRPTRQIFSVSLPNQIKIGYECIIWTDYVEQNNKILEQINYSTRDYWGDKERFKFKTIVDNYSVEQEVNEGTDRNVKTTFDINVNAYILNESYVAGLNGVKNTTQKLFTIRKIKLKEQAISDSQTMQDIKNNTSIKSFDDTTVIKDKNTDFAYVDGQGMEIVDKRNIKSDVTREKGKQTIIKSYFHAAPLMSRSYGENGWLAYDKDYLYIYQYPLGWTRRAIATFDFDANTGNYISGYDCNGDPIYSQGVRPINTAFRVFQRFPDKFYQQVPYQSEDYGEDGWISYDGNYFYIYSNNEWRRVPVALFEQF